MITNLRQGINYWDLMLPAYWQEQQKNRGNEKQNGTKEATNKATNKTTQAENKKRKQTPTEAGNKQHTNSDTNGQGYLYLRELGCGIRRDWLA